ncbi:MAG: SEC-C metal-binding domain-containing protein [Burkholderiales bacterium]
MSLDATLSVKPVRRAIEPAHSAGRNEPCPCGSGKKFTKCCGSPADLH